MTFSPFVDFPTASRRASKSIDTACAAVLCRGLRAAMTRRLATARRRWPAGRRSAMEAALIPSIFPDCVAPLADSLRSRAMSASTAAPTAARRGAASQEAMTMRSESLNQRRPHGTAGFTLIELMITVAVVGILAAVAYPSYQEHVRKSRRAAAQASMLEVAQKQMQLFLDVRGYSAAANAAAMAAAPLRVNIPANVQSSYDFKVEIAAPANAPPTFTITAAPKGAQAADKCGTMTLDHTGAKTPAAKCW